MNKYRVILKAVDPSKSGGVDTSLTINAPTKNNAIQEAKAQFSKKYPSWSERNLTVVSVSEV
jgi:hypothetical protein